MINDDTIQGFRLEALAARQLQDYDDRNPGTLFDDGIELGEQEAYLLQSAVAQLRVARGERLIGYKVGCTSPAIRAQLGINHSIRGCLFQSECYSDGTSLSIEKFASLAIEGELAIELSRRPTEDDFEPASAGLGFLSCVKRVFPVIELHHHVIRGNPSAGQLISNNAIHAGLVKGEGQLASEILTEVAAWSLEISEGDLPREKCEGSALAETIRSSLKWLLSQEHLLVESLQQGQIILTGSIPPLIPVGRSGLLRVDTYPFGSVHASFTE